MNWRDDQIAELARELGREDAELDDGETLEQLEARLARLRRLRDRVEQRQLEADDWALLSAVIRERM